MSNIIIPSFGNITDDRPLPEKIASLYGFQLAYHDVEDVRYYAVQEWILGIVPRSIVRKLWSTMKKRHPQLSTRCRQLPYPAANGRPYSMDYADAETLYIITQWMEANSGNRDAVLLYLAKAGVILDELIRDPEKAEAMFADLRDEQEYRKLLNEDFSPEAARQWIAERRLQIEEWNLIRADWKTRGVVGLGYAVLTNKVSEVALGKSATSLKRSMQIDGTPRDYLCAADNAAIRIVSTTSRILHQQRDSDGIDELSEDIRDVKPVADAMRPELDKLFSKQPRRLPPSKPKTSA